VSSDVEQQQLVRRRLPKAGRKEVTTRMVPELAEAVRHAAVRRGVSVNDFIVQAVEAALRRDPSENNEGLTELARVRARQALLAAIDELLPPEEAAAVSA